MCPLKVDLWHRNGWFPFRHCDPPFGGHYEETVKVATCLVSFFFRLFSTPNVLGHWTDLNQTWTRITAVWKILSELSRAFTQTGWWAKNRLLGPTLKVTEHISATEHDINNRKKTFQSIGSPLHALKFGKLWSRNGWKGLASFCQPPKFSHWETLPALPHGRYITDSRQTLARVM